MFKVLFSCFSVLLFLLIFSTKVHAQTVQVIESQVKLSVCGDAIVEGPEDCEGVDLNGSNCETEGFMSGTLTCTASCDFDTSECVPFPPSPSPSPTPTPTPTPTNNSSSVSQSASDQSTQNSSTTNATAERLAELVEILTDALFAQEQNEKIDISSLPPRVQLLIGSEQELTLSSLREILERFAVFWRQSLINPSVKSSEQQCDLDGNATCDIVDLSVLLYYVEVK